MLYGAVTLVFLIMSSSELLESGMSSPARLAGVLVTSVFWPVTLARAQQPMCWFVTAAGKFFSQSRKRLSICRIGLHCQIRDGNRRQDYRNSFAAILESLNEQTRL